MSLYLNYLKKHIDNHKVTKDCFQLFEVRNFKLPYFDYSYSDVLFFFFILKYVTNNAKTKCKISL